MASEEGTYRDLQEKSSAAEKAVQAAQQHYQAVTAGLSSSADGQDETLAAQKIGECQTTGEINHTLYDA